MNKKGKHVDYNAVQPTTVYAYRWRSFTAQTCRRSLKEGERHLAKEEFLANAQTHSIQPTMASSESFEAPTLFCGVLLFRRTRTASMTGQRHRSKEEHLANTKKPNLLSQPWPLASALKSQP